MGKAEHFSWKDLLDVTTCTECGRCQSQCSAWNTDKPLSPKLLMMTLRDHAHAKAPYLMATAEEREDLPAHVVKLADIPLIGDTGYDHNHPLRAYDALGPEAVIDADVLWSCTTCGACVEQCPVDIEHVDHIVDMRRYQVLLESAFPASSTACSATSSRSRTLGHGAARPDGLGQGPALRGPGLRRRRRGHGRGRPPLLPAAPGPSRTARKDLPGGRRAVSHGGVTFAVLGDSEACTGDSPRRSGNEMFFQMLAQGNVEMLNEIGAKKIVVTCAHCFNTLRNEYPSSAATTRSSTTPSCSTPSSRPASSSRSGALTRCRRPRTPRRWPPR